MILISESPDEVVFETGSGVRFKVSPEDKKLIELFTWTVSSYGYIVTSNGCCNWPYQGKQLARMILGLTGKQEADHKNLDRLNNRQDNLREATKSQNGANRRIQTCNKVGLKGVKRNHDRFMARGKLNGKEIYLGTFDTPEEAHEIYSDWARNTFGEFARTQ